MPLHTGYEAIDSASGLLTDAPGSYILDPSYLTSVKNQGNCGSCWAFATYASMESNILINGGPAEDLSENHLIENHGFVPAPCEGGNVNMSRSYLNSLKGPVHEADDPYTHLDGSTGTTPDGYTRSYTLRESNAFDTDEEIKQAVMDRGALYTSMYWDNAYYNSSDYTYYFGGAASTNHGVAIVGWDDTKVIGTHTGAWRIKNSWGTTFGDSGYFWLSYDDTTGGNSATSFEAMSGDYVSGVYEHDEFGYCNDINAPWAMNIFQKRHDTPIRSAGFYTLVDGAGYDIRIYDDYDPGTGLSGQLASVTGTATYEGYHVVDFEEWVTLPNDDDFVLCLYIDSGYTYHGRTYYQALEQAIAGYTTASSDPGQSFYSGDGSTWTDLNSLNGTANFCLKAYEAAEPTTLLMVVVGLGAIGQLRRKRGAQA